MDAFVYLALLFIGMAAVPLLADVLDQRKARRGPVDAREAYDQLPAWIHPSKDDQ